MLLGRALSRAVEAPWSVWRRLVLAVAAVLALYMDGETTLQTVRKELESVRNKNHLVVDPRLRGLTNEMVYFVGLPGENRVLGRADWAHDEWLYGQFERLRAAPPRAVWLRPGLTTGPIRVVVVPENPPYPIPINPPVVPGLSESLPELGYERRFNIGRYQIWMRRRAEVRLR
jgi:hypothetical protein